VPILTGEEVGERWNVIKAALKLSALPTADTSEEKMINMLKALLDGHALCWMTGNGRSPRTIVVTTLSIEEISQTKNLLIYCAHGFVKERPDQYIDLLKSIKDYAEKNGCDNIISYVWNDKIVKLLKMYGAECDYTLAVFPLHSKIERRMG
jgi:hypothetical protein